MRERRDKPPPPRGWACRRESSSATPSASEEPCAAVHRRTPPDADDDRLAAGVERGADELAGSAARRQEGIASRLREQREARRRSDIDDRGAPAVEQPIASPHGAAERIGDDGVRVSDHHAQRS